MTARKLRAVAQGTSKRQAILDQFAEALEIGPIESITQRGRDPLTAPYTMRMADDEQTDVRIGTIKVLRSQPALGDVLSVKLGRMPPILEAPFWHKLVSSVINHAIEVDEVEGESYSEMVREWLLRYSERALTDRNIACAHEHPFILTDEQGLRDLYVHVDGFVRNLDGEHSIKATAVEIRNALLDLGFERRTINYSRGNASSTRSYWTAPIDVLMPSDGLLG